jgi:hypothetical protein
VQQPQARLGRMALRRRDSGRAAEPRRGRQGDVAQHNRARARSMGMLRASELIGAQTKSHSEFLDTMHSRASSIPFEPGRIHSLPARASVGRTTPEATITLRHCNAVSLGSVRLSVGAASNAADGSDLEPSGWEQNAVKGPEPSIGVERFRRAGMRKLEPVGDHKENLANDFRPFLHPKILSISQACGESHSQWIGRLSAPRTQHQLARGAGGGFTSPSSSFSPAPSGLGRRLPTE